jgi:hypothetical protein
VKLVLCLLAFASLVLVRTPHHRGDPESLKPRTLLGIYQHAFADLPERWNAERLTFLAILGLGLFASVFPAILLAMLRWHRPPAGAAGGVAFGIVAVPAILGAVANAFLIVLNQTSFAFGGRPVPRDAILFAFGLAVLQTGFAAVSVAIGFSSRVVAAIH